MFSTSAAQRKACPRSFSIKSCGFLEKGSEKVNQKWEVDWKWKTTSY